MKKEVKVFVTVVSICVLFLMNTISAFAADYSSNSATASSQGHSGFSSKWKDYGCFNVGGHYYDFTYGYDTWFQNEDYINDVYAQRDYKTTYYGKVQNSKGSTDVTNKKSGTSKTNKADIKHTGSSVTYYVYAR